MGFFFQIVKDILAQRIPRVAGKLVFLVNSHNIKKEYTIVRDWNSNRLNLHNKYL